MERRSQPCTTKTVDTDRLYFIRSVVSFLARSLYLHIIYYVDQNENQTITIIVA